MMNILLPRWLQSWFDNLHLRNKLLLCYGSLIILSVNIVGILSFYYIQHDIYKQTSQSYAQTLEQITSNIEYKINTYDELLNQLTTDRSLTLSLAQNYTSPADYSYAYLNTIAKAFEIKLKYDSINTLIIYKNNDSLPEIGNDVIDLTNIEDASWFQQYFKDFAHFTVNDYIRLTKIKLWFISDIDGNKSISIFKPVFNDYEYLTAIMEMRVDYTDIFGDYIGKEFSPEEFIYIVDSSNHFIFHNKGTESDLPNLTSQHQEMIENAVENNAKLKEAGANLLLYDKGSPSGWNYFREVPMKNLLVKATEVRRFTIGISILSIIICFLIAFVFANMLQRRIKVLSSRMEQVDDLSLDTGIQFQGRDEIGNLALSYNRMIGRIKELVDQVQTSQQLQKESELKALQAQINPHFLYNTLATINWMAIDRKNDKIISMVENLAIFYRLSLNQGREHLLIREELNLVQAYIEIQQIRLESKIRVTYDVDPALLECITLKIILQPFVENAILHGAETKEGLTTVAIKGFASEGDIIFEIIDDGVGMQTTPALDGSSYIKTGYGIRNVQERIQLQYGTGYGIALYSKPGIGTKVTIRIPMKS